MIYNIPHVTYFNIFHSVFYLATILDILSVFSTMLVALQILLCMFNKMMCLQL